ncbi:copper homeostasis protein cutC homolog isoform X2 [Lepus europaeus]|uniref:copper homeostasis protein cutC homolog isoform X2 n=1 Tax=Lepus europaeus TaxID=9983 RepID=UPI002B487A35|nr:copper homeostasis protein cutC homolog isoform X2 [Lepus europaeus]
MKRQGLSSERKLAWISSGKAGAANGFLMEVCVDSVESAVNAERGGAGRIELCSGLLEGGTTPSMGLLQIVKQSVQIPVFVMIRPRGGDFLYSDREIEVMKADIQLAKLYGADGLVFGALTEDGQIDKELCMSLIALCRPLPVTFHRAFDMVQDPMAALETLLTLGFERVLTSGCDSSALEGLPLIKRLIDEVELERERSSFFHWFTPTNGRYSRCAVPIRSQEPDASSWSPMWVQGPKHLGHPPLPSLGHSRELDWKKSNRGRGTCAFEWNWSLAVTSRCCLGSLYSRSARRPPREMDSLHSPLGAKMK